jgi:hypothetical protein
MADSFLQKAAHTTQPLFVVPGIGLKVWLMTPPLNPIFIFR